MIIRGWIKRILHRKNFGERHGSALEIRSYTMRRPLPYLQSVRFADDLKIAKRMRRLQIEFDPKMAGCLGAVSIRTQRHRL